RDRARRRRLRRSRLRPPTLRSCPPGRSSVELPSSTTSASSSSRSLSGPPCSSSKASPGIGKTTLWQETIRRAGKQGIRVLASRPGASEARLTFVGLGDVLAGVGDEVLGELPAPQRRALDVALLRADPDGPGPEQRLVSTAFLGALRAL